LVDDYKTKHVNVEKIHRSGWCSPNDCGISSRCIVNDYWILICDRFNTQLLEDEPKGNPEQITSDLE
jgi:hypothetical protein